MPFQPYLRGVGELRRRGNVPRDLVEQGTFEGRAREQ